MSKLTTKQAVAQIKQLAADIKANSVEGFEYRTDRLREIGIIFDDTFVTDDLTPNGAYTKHKDALKDLPVQTTLVNECYYFAQMSETDFAAARKTYVRVGCGDNSRKANGEIKLQPAIFAQAVRAMLDTEAPGRWNRRTGEYTGKSGNTGGGKDPKVKAPSKPEASTVESVAGAIEEQVSFVKHAAASDATKLVKRVDEIDDELADYADGDWDLSALTVDELREIVNLAALYLERAELMTSK